MPLDPTGLMSADVLFALIAFAVVSTFSPGPNNIMLMASGANFGVWRTLPHMMGIAGGVVVLVLVVGAGLAQLFDLIPGSRAALKTASVLYLLWLAWKIARATSPQSETEQARPMTWLQAAAFQWINPKAWAMVLSALSVYAPGNGLGAVVIVAAVIGAVAVPSTGLWTILGRQLRRFLSDTRRLRLFNWTMAGLLVASIVPMLT